MNVNFRYSMHSTSTNFSLATDITREKLIINFYAHQIKYSNQMLGANKLTANISLFAFFPWHFLWFDN